MTKAWSCAAIIAPSGRLVISYGRAWIRWRRPQAFAVQTVSICDAVGHGPPAGCPSHLKALAASRQARSRTMPAARAVASEEEQFGPASGGHHGAPDALVIQSTGDPGLGCPTLPEKGPRGGVMDDATIAREGAPLRDSHYFSERCDSILQRHGSDQSGLLICEICVICGFFASLFPPRMRRRGGQSRTIRRFR